MGTIGKGLQILGLLATSFGLYVGFTQTDGERDMLLFGLGGFAVFYLGIWFRGRVT